MPTAQRTGSGWRLELAMSSRSWATPAFSQCAPRWATGVSKGVETQSGTPVQDADIPTCVLTNSQNTHCWSWLHTLENQVVKSLYHIFPFHMSLGTHHLYNPLEGVVSCPLCLLTGFTSWPDMLTSPELLLILYMLLCFFRSPPYLQPYASWRPRKYRIR